MYDVRGKSVSGDSKGRMQEAVDGWEKSAKAAVGKNEKNDEGEIDSEVKSTIKKKFNEIASDKAKTVEKQINGLGGSEKTEPPLPPLSDEQNAANFIETGAENFSKQPDGQSDEFFTGSKDFNAVIESDDEPLDYESEEQAQEILSDQSSLQRSLIFRFAGCIVCAVILAWLAVAPELNIPLPIYINVSKSPSYYISANLILLILAGIIGFPVAFKGIVSLFTFKPDADSLTSLSFYAALVGGGYTLYSYAFSAAVPAGLPATAVFASCAAASLSFNLLGKVFLVARVKRNFKFISAKANVRDGFYAAVSLEPSKAHDLMRTFQGTPSVVTTDEVKFLTNYLEQSYEYTPSDRASRLFAPIALIAALLSAACELLIKKDIAGAVIAFSAVCCTASPLLLEIGVAVPFYRSCKRLVKQQALVTGCNTVSEFGGTDAVVADGSLIFPECATSIFSIKTFSHHRIDEAVLYASSIAYAGKSPLASAFMGIYADAGSGKNLLRTVQKLVYEDEKGLSAIIDDKVVLLGNRGLLRHHLIDSPSRDYEMRNTADGKDLVYLAIDGVIYAMFIVEYGVNTKISAALRKLRRFGIHLLIKSSDPNITPLLLEEKCGSSANNALMLGAREMQILEGEKSDDRRPAGLAFKDLAGYAAGVVSCIKLNGTLRANTALQVVLSLFGMLIVTYCVSFAGGAASVAPAFVLAYQVLCSLPVLIISLFRRS